MLKFNLSQIMKLEGLNVEVEMNPEDLGKIVSFIPSFVKEMSSSIKESWDEIKPTLNDIIGWYATEEMNAKKADYDMQEYEANRLYNLQELQKKLGVDVTISVDNRKYKFERNPFEEPESESLKEKLNSKINEAMETKDFNEINLGLKKNDKE